MFLKTRILGNLRAQDAVTMAMPDGQTLRSTPVALGWLDAAAGRGALIAQVVDCAGELVASNKVVFRRAFDNVDADIVYTITKGTFEQDVVLRAPVNPADAGFAPETALLCVYTEFYAPPEPERVRQPLRVEEREEVRGRMVRPDFVDEMLIFGGLDIPTGRVFPIGKGKERTVAGVAKEWTTLGSESRTFMIESAEYTSIREEMEAFGDRREQGDTDDGLVIDYVVELNQAWANLPENRVFRGDTTYHVIGPVTCGGSTSWVIEGGTVFKYRWSSGVNPANPTTYIKFTGPLTCKTTSYLPAIFTAEGDATIGEHVTENPVDMSSGHYANPAIWTYNVSPTFSNLRFRYAEEAVRIEASHGYSATVSHSQIVDCMKGVTVVGAGSGSGSVVCITVNNCLLAQAKCPLTARFQCSGNLYNCTVDGRSDNTTCLITASAAASFNFVNSVFSRIPTKFSGSVTLTGNYNGFYQASDFGANAQWETEVWPFEPTTVTVDGVVYPRVANGQGAYYLRCGSAFCDVGLGAVSSGLKKELCNRSTAPPEILTGPVTYDRILGQSSVRDGGDLDLGYHYPAVDRVLAAASLNNTILQVEQGTVLAFTAPYSSSPNYYPEWGLRLNPGSQLIVRGAPTNRVVFARLEAVQEAPFLAWQWGGPLITFKGVLLDGLPVTPLPEAAIRFADFPVPSGWNGLQFGELMSDVTYDVVGRLELDSCHFAGGAICYDSGGPDGRRLILRNNLFQRVSLLIGNYGDYNGTAEEELSAFNNLFYFCWMLLSPRVGSRWAFTDNIFDHVAFAEDGSGQPYNGPVGTNHHNAYVGMARRLRPAAPVVTDPDVPSLEYAAGALGRFYLPSTATALLDKGSRLAKDAGMCHFTSLTTNVKERDEAGEPKQVNIGHHYVALAGSVAADFDGDGLPDYLEDANGDGLTQAGAGDWSVAENDWTSVPSVPVALPSSLNGAVLSGVVRIPVIFDNAAGDIYAVTLRSHTASPETDSSLPCINLVRPFGSPLCVTVDTRHLPNGPLTLKAVLLRLGPQDDSEPVTVTVDNPVSFSQWTSDSSETTAAFLVDAAGQPTGYTLTIFDDSFAEGRNPLAVNECSGTPVAGEIREICELAYHCWADPGYYFAAVTIDEPGGGRTVLTPPKRIIGDTFPERGRWSIGWEDSYHVFWLPDGSANPDVKPRPVKKVSVVDPVWWPEISEGLRGALNHWLPFPLWVSGTPPQPPVCLIGLCRRQLSVSEWTSPETPDVVPWPPPTETLGIPIQNSQTWPIRSDDSYAKRLEDPKNPNIRPAAYVQRDWAEWLRQVSNPEVRNLYIASHMTESSIGELGVDELNAWIHHRFRFVFLDGCRSGKGALFEAFGMRGDERVGPVAREYYTGGGWLVGDKVFVDSEKRRPAVFLGYGVAHSWYKPFENIDWTSSFPTVGEIPQQVGRFLKAFLDGMVIYGRNVRDALEEARNQSNGSNLMCWDGNRMLTWNPGRCMVVCGYEEMRMSGTQDCFNWAGQWPLP